ncbi:SDR family NAD(P)-dependent oxidoreductase [Pseudoduganella umbonata]|uniref:SDR family NAD(P)-dependent oxidoreductase n=1 Tax=Pseudoduganella umbonata TaxID=864828 RepID=A0A4V1EDW9_9BURK|nr:SDR family NAD(P)-dependent oxidoreductase [Pseudoduganella umbonata]MBB3222324.1 short-subunit dehydrogenase [Pseudoduganella umbonata]QCP12541.1 SDR family NAD(P)-dependent oxidoreductase [Pseudoduganella umbonata]
MRYLILLLCVAQLAGCATRLSADERTAVAGKTYVITGASSGFGKGVALELAAMRANVVLAARRTDALQAVAAEATARGGSALAVTTDVSRPDEVQRLLDAAVARFGRVDVWINNAAVGAIGVFDTVAVEDHARIVDVNLKGLIYGSHVALRQFRRQGAGTLVNIGSVESVIPQAYHASYSATKAATLSLGRSLNEELRLTGAGNIAVATVLPWATDTPFFNHAANYSGGTPRMPLMDEPQKVVDAIVWISVNPQEELAVGWKAKTAYAGARLAPDLAERAAASAAHRYQFETAPPAPVTSGALHQPMAGTTGVDGGHRERIERENERNAAQRRGE